MNRRQLLQSIAAAPVAATRASRTTGAVTQPGNAGSAADHVIVISLDGVRIQEMFGGLDTTVLQAYLEKKPMNEHPVYKRFWRETREARREALMPFLWGTFLKEHGSIVGDQQAGSVMQLGNALRFSYPGYAELMTGTPHDDVITSNDNRRYPYETVLQFLKRELGATREQVACFGSWDVFTSIAASKDDEVYTNAGYQAYDVPDAGLRRLSAAQFDTVPPWESARYDTYTWQFAMDHLQRHQPRVLWIGLDETDDWSHNRHYVRVVEYLHRFDGWLAGLWRTLQSMPAYQGKTAVMLVTDHGRGNTTADWNGHGKDVEGAQNVWAAIAAPHWSARGVWKAGHRPASQSQVAATIASLVGKDWKKASPAAGAPLVPPT